MLVAWIWRCVEYLQPCARSISEFFGRACAFAIVPQLYHAPAGKAGYAQAACKITTAVLARYRPIAGKMSSTRMHTQHKQSTTVASSAPSEPRPTHRQPQ